MDTSLTTIKLKAEDSCGRQHLITLKLNAKVNSYGRKYYKASLKKKDFLIYKDFRVGLFVSMSVVSIMCFLCLFLRNYFIKSRVFRLYLHWKFIIRYAYSVGIFLYEAVHYMKNPLWYCYYFSVLQTKPLGEFHSLFTQSRGWASDKNRGCWVASLASLTA